MAGFTLSKKSHAAGSLAWRVVTICSLLLVIPLFFQSFFLYNQEYKEKLNDIKTDLQLLASERAYLIEELVQMNWNFLDNIGNLEFNSKSDIKHFAIQRIPLPRGVGDRFAIVGRHHDLLVGKKESNINALVSSIPYTLFLEHLNSPYPIRIALIDSKGKKIVENMQVKEGVDLLEIKKPIEGTQLELELTVQKNLILELHKQSYYFRFATLLFFVGVIGGGAVYWLTRRIERPLNKLCKTMEKVSFGAVHARYTPDWMGFEINALGVQFNQMLDSLLESMQETQKEKIRREKLAEELRIGHEIQSSLLPSHIPGFPGVEIAVGYLPAKEVNGDFYDLFPLETGKLLIVMCDTAGKGISACLYSLGLRSIIRSVATLTDDLSEIVLRANDLFWLDTHSSGMFSTLWIGLYDPSNQLLTYCSQGHPPALLKRGDLLDHLWTEGIALGAQKFDAVATRQISLLKGDLLFLYTDGIIEAHNIDHQLFGKERLEQFLRQKKTASPELLAGQLLEEVRLFSHGTPQHDDMTLLFLHLHN